MPTLTTWSGAGIVTSHVCIAQVPCSVLDHDSRKEERFLGKTICGLYRLPHILGSGYLFPGGP